MRPSHPPSHQPNLKVRHDLVRPPSIVHDLLDDEIVNTWAGHFAGAQDIPARDWEPYIRTMPHAGWWWMRRGSRSQI